MAFSIRSLDGYVLNPSNNTFVSPWIDIHNSPYFNISTTFSNSTNLAGTLYLQQSNDLDCFGHNGRHFPMSARMVGAYGINDLGDPIDLANVGSVSVTPSLNPAVFNNTGAGMAWIRVLYLPTTSINTNVSVYVSFKRSH